MSAHGLRNCEVLFPLVSDLARAVGSKCILMLILYGSSLEKGCNKQSDIDLLLVTPDNCLYSKSSINEIYKKYKSEGYTISLNVVPFSKLLEYIALGDTLVLNAIIKGLPLMGHDVATSLKNYLASPSVVRVDRTFILDKINTLLREADALYNFFIRDLYTSCSTLKTALAHVITLKTNNYDPNLALNALNDNELVDIYNELTTLCHKILAEDASLSEISKSFARAKLFLNELLKELSKSTKGQ